MKQETWTEAVRPTLAVRGKKILFLSTPKGKNWFYDMFQLGQSSDYPNYKSYQAQSQDSPFISNEEIIDAKNTLPPNIFKQEYMAEFLDDGGEVFTNLNANTFNQYPRPNGTVYCGIDLGRANDYTVATFIDNTGNTVDIYRANGKSWSDMTNELSAIINKYNAVTMVEVNSIGDVIYEQLKNKVKTIYPFVTSNKSKQEIIEGLILDFNEGNIKIPSRELFQPLYDELGYFTYQYNPKTRNVSYGHPSGLHDDTVISLALANYTRKTQSKKGTYNYVAAYI
jgi:hypothetical protein